MELRKEKCMLNIWKDFLRVRSIRPWNSLPKLMEDDPAPESYWSGEDAGEHIVGNNPALVMGVGKRT